MLFYFTHLQLPYPIIDKNHCNLLCPSHILMFILNFNSIKLMFSFGSISRFQINYRGLELSRVLDQLPNSDVRNQLDSVAV